MLLSVVVVNWNSRDDLSACLSSLRLQTHRELQVIVVDNGSEDGSADMVEADFPECRLLRQATNLGFAEACNRGIDASSGEWVAMLNNDAVAEADFAKALVDAARAAPPECGMLQSLLLFQGREGVINSTGIELTPTGGGRDRDEGRARPVQTGVEEIFCPTAGAAAYRRSMLDAIRLPEGYFDREHFMYYEDMDLGWRARLAGYSARYIPASVVHHKWHGSTVRRGRSWLKVLASTNRIRTLVKNSSGSFLLRTAPTSAREVFEVAVHGRMRGLRSLADATRKSALQRARVKALTTVDRRAVERRWLVKG